MDGDSFVDCANDIRGRNWLFYKRTNINETLSMCPLIVKTYHPTSVAGNE
jgi:hypothetical protein